MQDSAGFSAHSVHCKIILRISKQQPEANNDQASWFVSIKLRPDSLHIWDLLKHVFKEVENVNMLILTAKMVTMLIQLNLL